MKYVYRYTDLSDGIIKYVGIVCRKCEDGLQRRIKEHAQNDVWTFNKSWKIEYIEVETLNDAHSLESHFIAKYNTSDWYNIQSAKEGLLSFINDDFEWKVAEECLMVEAKKIQKYSNDKIKEILHLRESLARRMGEITTSIKIITNFLENKDYSLFSEDVLRKDLKELIETRDRIIQFELSRPTYII